LEEVFGLSPNDVLYILSDFFLDYQGVTHEAGKKSWKKLAWCCKIALPLRGI